jgi:hypothetical protein
MAITPHDHDQEGAMRTPQPTMSTTSHGLEPDVCLIRSPSRATSARPQTRLFWD